MRLAVERGDLCSVYQLARPPSIDEKRREEVSKKEGEALWEFATNNNQIVSFHDQAGGQEHSPEDRFFVFFQCLAHCQQPVGCIALLRKVDELDSVRIAQFKALELALSRDDLFCRHSGLEVARFEVGNVETSARPGDTQLI